MNATESPQSAQPIPAQQTYGSEIIATQPKRRIPKWLKVTGIIIFVLIALASVGGITANEATKAPLKVSDEFINDIQAGRIDEAYALTNNSFQKVTSKQQLADYVQRVHPIIDGQEKVSNKNIMKYSGSPAIATFAYNVKTADGTTYMATKLQKSNETWQIINFNTNSQPLGSTN